MVNLLQDIVQYLVLCLLILNSPLGFCILVPIDLIFKLGLFHDVKLTPEELKEELILLQQMIDDYAISIKN